MPATLTQSTPPALFAPQTRWIWDETDPATTERYYLRARRSFGLSAAEIEQIRTEGCARVKIFAASYFQLWLNGVCIGHGPAKSPEGEAFVDTHDISQPGILHAGDNLLEVLVYATGTGTMVAADAPAGLIFQIELPASRIVHSDTATEICADKHYRLNTARRWLLPCIEDFDAAAADATDSALGNGSQWAPARLIDSPLTLLPRPIAQASRRSLCPERLVAADIVALPQFSVSFRIKPYLVAAAEQRRSNVFTAPALIVTDLISEQDQEIHFVPATGHIVWYFEGRKLVTSNGWERWKNAAADVAPHAGIALRLRAGTNRLIGVHRDNNHFEAVHLVAFCQAQLSVRNPFGTGGFQIIPLESEQWEQLGSEAQFIPQWLEAFIETAERPAMLAAHTMEQANPQDRVVNALWQSQYDPQTGLAANPSGDGFPTGPAAALLPEARCSDFYMPAATQSLASRLVLDLGAVQNGHLSFTAFGKRGSTLTFSFCEALEPGAPLRIIWPGACNNALVYRLKDGWQRFESLLPYGVRYVCIHHEGTAPVRVTGLHFTSVHCGGSPAAAIRSGDVALDAIHALCEQTLVAATDNTLTDCPTYEMVNWNFDNRLGTLADLTTCRSIDVLRNTIEQYTRDPQYPGLVRCHTPSTWETRIPSFSFHWILLCRDFHWSTGEDDFARRVFAQVQRGLAEALGMLHPQLGLLHWPVSAESWHLMDWAQHRDDTHAIVSAEQALLLGSLEAGEYLAAVVGSPEATALAAQWQAAREKLKAAIEQHLWVESRDSFADSLHADGSQSAVSSEVSNAALALHGVGSAAWQKRLHSRLQSRQFDNSESGNCGGEHTSVRHAQQLLPFGSPMGLFYVLEFLDKCDDAQTIFHIIREKWTPMLLAGDRTAWEHFPEFGGNPQEPTRSRCHPFATYILKYYVKYLLGITFTASGQRQAQFLPQPPQGIDAVQGALPVRGGWIRVSWHRSAEGSTAVSSRIEAPQSIDITAPHSLRKTAPLV